MPRNVRKRLQSIRVEYVVGRAREIRQIMVLSWFLIVFPVWSSVRMIADFGADFGREMRYMKAKWFFYHPPDLIICLLILY